MAKRMHPKTIEDKLHQILYMDQCPEEVGVISNKKGYSRLDIAKCNDISTLGGLKFPPETHNEQKHFKIDGYPRNKIGRSNIKKYAQNSTVESYFFRSNK